MRLRDLSKENPFHSDVYKLKFLMMGSTEPSEEFLQRFQQDWLNGEAKFLDWLTVRTIDLNGLEKASKLTKPKLNKIKQRRHQLYDWFIEYKVQIFLLKRLYRVLEFTPFGAVSFAKYELEKINKFLSGKLDWDDSELLLSNLSFPIEKEYQNVIANWEEKDFNIHSSFGYVEIDLMKRYATYLESFIADNGLIEKPAQAKRPEYTVLSIFEGLVDLSENIIITYTNVQFNYKGVHNDSFELAMVCGCYHTNDFKRLIRTQISDGFTEFIKIIQHISIKDRAEVYELLVSEIEKLKLKVVEGEWNDYGENINNAKDKFKYFVNAKFKGDKDEVVAFSNNAQDNINANSESFAIAWVEVMDEMIRRVEHASFNEDLIQFNDDAKDALNKSGLSFKFIGKNIHTLYALYRKMREQNLIAASTSLHNFTKVFTGGKVYNRIIWTGTIEELSYFIKQLHNVKKMVENKGKLHWEAACNCFIMPKMKYFDRSQLRGQKKPSSAKRIESLVNSLE